MVRIFNLDFFEGNEKDCIKQITSQDEKSIIFTPNIDHIIKINKDKDLFDKYSSGNYIVADGWPVALVGKLKGGNVSRITGVDIMDRLLDYSNENNKNIFFLGSEEDTLKRLESNLKKKYKNIGNISSNHGYFNNNEDVIEKINRNFTDILFVGMGCPKQEKWISESKDKLNCSIIIGIGGALKIYSGEVDRAPKIIQKLGIEWFYRFLKEPRRLFKRYFIEYFKFIPIFLKEIV